MCGRVKIESCHHAHGHVVLADDNDIMHNDQESKDDKAEEAIVENDESLKT